MPPKTRLRTSISSHDSPDPLALSDNGIQRATSPTKFSPLKTRSPNRQKKQQQHSTPKRARDSDPFLEESRTKSVTSHSVSQPGSGSPWKIRVTVEAEPEEEDAQGSPLRRKNNVLTRDTVTTTVPLRAADGGTPVRRRGRPSKSSPTTGSSTKRKRPSTPAKRSPASDQDDGISAITHDDDNGDLELPSQVNKKRRGRTRRSEAQEIADEALLQPESSPPRAVDNSYEPTAQNYADNADHRGFEDVVISADQVPQAQVSKTLAERLLAEDDTTALDLSAIESEGFSMVSIESLRSEKEKAARQEKLKLANNRLDTVSEAPVPQMDDSHGIQASNNERHDVEEAATREELNEQESETSGLRPDQLQRTRTNALRSSFGFGQGTFKDLRARFMMGELLSRGNLGLDMAPVVEEPLEATRFQLGNQAPQKESPPYPRLPTPADSVEGDTSFHGKSGPTTQHNAAKSSSHSLVKDYDEMSWIPTNQPRKPTLSDSESQAQMSQHTDAAAGSLLSRSNLSNKNGSRPSIRDNENRAVASTPRTKKVSQTVGTESPVDVTMADEEDMWQVEADRSFEESNEGRSRPLPKLPTKTPDWNDLLGEDNRPLRSKIPRSWRRASGDYFKYSDEIDGEETPNPSPKRNQPQASYGLDKYYSSEESTLEPEVEDPGTDKSIVDRAIAFINGSTFTTESTGAKHHTGTDTEPVIVEESSISEAIPRQQQSLFDPKKRYSQLFNTPKTPMSPTSQFFGTPQSFVSDDADQSEVFVTELGSESSISTVAGKQGVRRHSTGSSLFTRISSWFFGPPVPRGTIWDRNHYVLLDWCYRKDHAQSMLPPLPRSLASYIGTGRYNEDHDIEHTFTEHDMRTAYVFIQEAKNEGVPQVCDGQFLRPSESAKIDENGKPYPLRDENGKLVRVKQVWDVEEVSHRVFTIWLGDLLRAQKEEEDEEEVDEEEVDEDELEDGASEPCSSP